MKLLLSKSLLASLVLAVFVSACGDDDPDTGPSTLTVTYSGNAPSGGTPPRDSNTYRTGDTVTILGPGTLVKDGFYFAGWTSTAGASYQPGDTFQMGTANVLLYASWSESPTYTVSYSGNGNTSGAPPQDGESYVAGETVTVLGAGTMTKEGNTFAGWTDGGSTYQAGGTFTMGAADVTLTAVWTAVPTYHVTYNANGATSGTAPVDTGAYPQGAQVTVLGQGTLAKTNASFGGWLMNATTLAPAASFAMPAANVELVAIWNDTPLFTVSYDDGGADSGTLPASSEHPEGFALTLPPRGDLVRDGYEFSGWSDGTAIYGEGAEYIIGTADVLFTAAWNVETFSVTYVSTDHTGGEVPTDGVVYEDGAPVTVKASNLVRTGYRFDGWSHSGGGAYDEGETFDIDGADVTLTAQWAQEFTLTYDGNGNTAGTVPGAVSLIEGQTSTVAAGGDLVIDAQCFAFWNTVADRTGSNYLAGEIFTMGTTSTTLYAQYNTPPQLLVDGANVDTDDEIRIVPVSITPVLAMADVDYAIDVNASASFEATVSGAAGVAFDVAAIEAVIDPLTSDLFTIAADSVTFEGTLAELNQAIGALQVLPPTDGFGLGEIVVSISDLGMIGDCELTDQATISLEWLP